MSKGGTPKVPRKSTHIDMTAFCDVTFLLLTFFMLATKFKAPEPVEIKVPNSVSTKPVPEDNVIVITFDSTGKVFLSLDKIDQKVSLLNYLNKQVKLGLTDDEISKLANEPFFGYPLAGIKTFLSGGYGKNIPGIPVDSAVGGRNELTTWIAGLIETYSYRSKRPDIIVKGDAGASYPSFSQVIESFKRNRLFTFKLVTSQEPIPEGTALYASQKKQSGGEQGEKVTN